MLWLKQRFFSGMALLILTLIATACSNTVTVSSNNGSITPTVSTNATPTVTPSPTTGTAASPCLNTLPGSSPATAGAGFGDVTFPTGSTSTPITVHHNATGDYTISLFSVCSPNNTVDGVRSFFATQLPANSWAQAPTLPFDGGFQDSCGDPYCWVKDVAPRYVGLEQVKDQGSQLVTYNMRLFTPPTAPTCSSDFPANYSSFYTAPNTTASVPLPALTKIGPSTNVDQLGSNLMCSAGTTASLNMYLTTELPKHGWHQGSTSHIGNTGPCGHFTGWVNQNSTVGVYWSVDTSVSNGVQWHILLSC
jgi:hypothetical protein